MTVYLRVRARVNLRGYVGVRGETTVLESDEAFRLADAGLVDVVRIEDAEESLLWAEEPGYDRGGPLDPRRYFRL